jgi:hypothetical protein
METRIEKEGATFRASGNYDPNVQREIISSYVRAQLIKQVALYGVSTVFILSGSFLIAFSPTGREQTSAIIAAALFAMAIGLSGFSYFKIRAPLVSAEVGTTLNQSSESAKLVKSHDEGNQNEHPK